MTKEATSFLARVYRMPGDEEDCWLWGGSLNEDGYGVVTVLSAGKAKGYYAHVVSWEHANQASIIGPHVCVCHRCDNRWCTNPRHLWLGTRGDNVRDAAQKGRMHRGQKNGTVKLTEEAVRAIRDAVEDGEEQDAVARRFGVSQANVSWIVLRKGWRHIK